MTSKYTPSDASDSACAALADLYSGPLQKVSFPEVDGLILRQLSEEQARLRDELARAKQAVEIAEAAVAEHQLKWLQTSQLAMAYARVFAKGDDALLAAIERIALPKGTRPQKHRPSPRSEDGLVKRTPQRGRRAKPDEGSTASALAAE